jgi:mono/diheme cytochrome c family protein
VKLPAVCFLLAGVAAAQEASPKDVRFFDRRVAPILQRRCVACHNQELRDGGISFLDRDSLLKGGSRGPAIVPGDPERSVLIRAIRHNSDPQMPPGPKLPAKDIASLTEWVRRGAPWGTKLRVP